MDVAELAKFNSEERAAYEHSLKNYRDLQNVKDTYFQEGEQKGRIEGIKEGIKEGENKGKLEGKIEGRIEGRLEGKIEAAIHARKQGFPIDVIVSIFQIPEKELLKIFDDMGI